MQLIQAISPWLPPICQVNAAQLRAAFGHHTPRVAAQAVHNYLNDISRQVLAELNEVLAAKLEQYQRGQSQPVPATVSRTIRNNNLRIFSQWQDLTPGKYLLLLMLGDGTLKTVFADFGGDNFITINLKDNPNQQPLAGKALTVLVLANLTPFMRAYQASQQPRTPLLTKIAYGHITPDFVPSPPNLCKQRIQQVNQTLNPSQLNAAAAFLALPEGLQIIMGPPGTGKTTTITTLIESLIREKTKRIFVCGPSNKSVQVIALKFHSQFPQRLMFYLSADPSLDECLLHLTPLGWKKQISKRINEALQTIDTMPIKPIQDLLRLCQRTASTQVTQTTLTRQEAAAYFLIWRREINAMSEASLLNKADLLLSTLSASGRPAILKQFKQVDVLIIDEAGQSSEPETLIALQLNPKKVLLIGDVEQLQPTILASEPEQYHYNWSMIWRFCKELQQPSHMLTEQYRMRAEISLFPRNAFYHGKLRDGQPDRTPLLPDVAPYQVFDIANGHECRDPASNSYYNIAEANHVVTTLAHLLAHCDTTQVSIAILTPYSAQVACIKALAKAAGVSLDKIDINTIDSFQGEERTVVLLSMVRANLQMAIGFMRAHQRLNVAITRPKEVLHIMLSGKTFNPLHPKSQLEKDVLTLISQTKVIPLPTDERDNDYALAVNNFSQYSPEGYRSSLDDYRQYYTYDDEYGCFEPISQQELEFIASLHALHMHSDTDTITQFADSSRIVGHPTLVNIVKLYQHYHKLPGVIGKLPIFSIPDFPFRTHLVQDILNMQKRWVNLTFQWLPEHAFASYQFKMYAKMEAEYADYGHPFDAADNYIPSGYGIGYGVELETEMHEQDLIFDNHAFIGCDLSGINFHDSHFKNTRFDGSNVQSCRVNLQNMDAFSSASFLQAQACSKTSTLKTLPTEQLVMNAIKRGLFKVIGTPQSEPTTDAAPAKQPSQPNF